MRPSAVIRRVLAVVAVALSLSACDYGDGLAEQELRLKNPPPEITVDPATAPVGVTTYLTARGNPSGGKSIQGGRRIAAPEDVAKLAAGPAAFRSFIDDQLASNNAAVKSDRTAKGKKHLPKRCDNIGARFTVWGMDADVATGREWWCTRPANEVIWIRDGAQWRTAARMRGGWDCSVLDRYEVPAIITAAVCWEKDGRTVRDYTGPAS